MVSLTVSSMVASNNGRATSLPPATTCAPAVKKANIPDEMMIQFIVFLPKISSQESPLASSMASARAAEFAEAMPEVAKGR